MTANRERGLIALLGVNLVFMLIAASKLSADQIEMQSGDRYVGRVVAVTNDTLVIQSELLGTLRLPRSKVVSINLGPGTPTIIARVPARTNHLTLTATSATNASRNAMSMRAPNSPSSQTSPRGEGEPDFSAALGQLGAGTNSIHQVQQQFLSEASPEANQKFNELVSGLMSGKLNLSDIRAEAASAAKQLRTLKQDLGNDAGSAVDGYLAILDAFLREATLPAGSASKAPVAAPKAKTAPAKEED